MKKRVMFMALVVLMSVIITGLRSKAAEKQDFYTIVKNGVESDVESMEEDEGYTVLSVKSQECVTEKVYTIEVRFVSDGEQYRLWVYLDKYQDEAIAILYDGDGEVEDQSRMSLTEAARDYM